MAITQLKPTSFTDVIKSRGKVGDPYPEEKRPHREAFDKEIQIVQPRYIVTFGQKVFDLLQFSLAGSCIKMYQVYHYAYARRGATAPNPSRKGFARSFENVADYGGEGP